MVRERKRTLFLKGITIAKDHKYLEVKDNAGIKVILDNGVVINKSSGKFTEDEIIEFLKKVVYEVEPL